MFITNYTACILLRLIAYTICIVCVHVEKSESVCECSNWPALSCPVYMWPAGSRCASLASIRVLPLLVWGDLHYVVKCNRHILGLVSLQMSFTLVQLLRRRPQSLGPAAAAVAASGVCICIHSCVLNVHVCSMYAMRCRCM